MSDVASASESVRPSAKGQSGPSRPAWIDDLQASLGAVIRGKKEAIDLVLVGLLAGGHVLLEDVPGTGKTTLAKALAASISVDFARVQFTPDLLPADILGAQVLNPKEGTFRFQPGPIFTSVMLADEINRASPRTQSALLEAMNEEQVTVDGATRPLPKPFFVIATQNPIDFQGTYPLPEAQLDRFILRTSLGYPAEDAELAMLTDRRRSDPLDAVAAVADREQLAEAQRRVREVSIKDDVSRYLLRIVATTRSHKQLALGVSPRGSLALLRASQARALLDGRSYVTPDDIQRMCGPVLAHRIQPTQKARYGGERTEAIVVQVLESVSVPT